MNNVIFLEERFIEYIIEHVCAYLYVMDRSFENDSLWGHVKLDSSSSKSDFSSELSDTGLNSLATKRGASNQLLELRTTTRFPDDVVYVEFVDTLAHRGTVPESNNQLTIFKRPLISLISCSVSSGRFNSSVFCFSIRESAKECCCSSGASSESGCVSRLVLRRRRGFSTSAGGCREQTTTVSDVFLPLLNFPSLLSLHGGSYESERHPLETRECLR